MIQAYTSTILQTLAAASWLLAEIQGTGYHSYLRACLFPCFSTGLVRPARVETTPDPINQVGSLCGPMKHVLLLWNAISLEIHTALILFHKLLNPSDCCSYLSISCIVFFGSVRLVRNLRELRCSRFYLDRNIIVSATWVLADVLWFLCSCIDIDV